MASSFGGTIKLTGESEYKRALANITGNLKVLNSEMQLVSSQYDKNDSSSKKYNQQSEVLNKKIEEQKEKVELLTKALEDSKNETGETSNTTKKWQTELNKAKTELNNMGRELDDNSKKTSVFGDVLKANLLSEGIIAGIKSLGGAMKQLGSAIFDIGKNAIESYANYEQLVGGVETLFKDSSGVVESYANNAYKTAGISANTYMEQATSFSATLLQGLKGDTAKAAEYADIAIKDMADNANKMGTDMSLIQNAYQGFAKDNYDMLDNLKLGYGGTQGEMARLINDSGVMGAKFKATAENVKNIPFDKMIEAIHKTQEEMGITGTTAKEASTTISGSVSSMKSAWNNMLTGIADDNADFGVLITNLTDSIITAAKNLLPRIKEALGGISDLFTGLATELLPQILKMGIELVSDLIKGMNKNLPSIMNTINQIIATILNVFIENLPQILKMGITMLTELINGLSQNLPSLIPTIVDAVILMATTLTDNIPTIIMAGVEILIALTQGIIEAMPDLIQFIPTIIAKIVEALIEALPMLLAASVRIIVELAKGLIVAIPQLVVMIPQIIAAIVGGLINGVKDMAGVGKNLVSGIWDGISNSFEWIKTKLKEWVGNVTKFIKKMFGINSPSTLFRDEIGKNLALGLGNGFSNTMADVSKDMANAIPTEFDTNINSNINSNIGASNNDSMIKAFKEALGQMHVTLDDEKVGGFVENTITRVIYS